MLTPTDEQIAAAVPVNGNPSRALTNALLLKLAAASRRTETQVFRVNNPVENQEVDLSKVATNATVVVDAPAFIAQINLKLPDASTQWIGQTIQVFTTKQVYSFDMVSPSTITGTGSAIQRSFQFTIQNVGLNDWAPVSLA
jgi:hypothetical protein